MNVFVLQLDLQFMLKSVMLQLKCDWQILNFLITVINAFHGAREAGARQKNILSVI